MQPEKGKVSGEKAKQVCQLSGVCVCVCVCVCVRACVRACVCAYMVHACKRAVFVILGVLLYVYVLHTVYAYTVLLSMGGYLQYELFIVCTHIYINGVV